MIFESPSKRRWKVAMALLGCFALLLSASIAVRIVSDVRSPPIPSLGTLDAALATKSPPLRDKGLGLPDYSHQSLTRAAFIMQRDDNSVVSLKKHISELDVVFPDWFTFTGEKDAIGTDIDPEIKQFLSDHQLEVIPTIANLAPGRWMGESLSRYVGEPQNRTKLSHLILEKLSENGLRAINLDFEQIDAASMMSYLKFLTELTELLHANNMAVTIDVPLDNDDFDYEEIGNIVDLVVVMAYDQHYEQSKPGPIASQSWFTAKLSRILEVIPPEKTIVALGQYSYDWDKDSGTAETLDFYQAIDRARSHESTIATDDESINSTFSYVEANGHRHEVWMLDAVSLWNELLVLREQQVYGLSIWRTGSEDATIWSFYSKKNQGNVEVVKRVGALESADYDGEGEFLKVESSPREGERAISVEDGMIRHSSYRTLPTGYQVRTFGHDPGKKIALTFDDGPDPSYTPQILDVLKKHNIQASFFVVGEQAARWPNILRRAVAEGHTIGSHTYYHTDDTQVDDGRLKLELDATQRVIKAITHRDSTLFRSPYIVESTPETSDILHPLDVVSQLGYLVVNADIDSEDYASPGVTHIVDSVTKGLEQTGSNVILFHDGGGDRSQTIAALEILIPQLEAKGYDFVTPNDLLGVPREAVLKELPAGDAVLAENDSVWMDVASWAHDWAWRLVNALFLATLLIGIFRIALLSLLVDRSRRRERGAMAHFQPFVSVLIPACDEEKVIAKTLGALMRSDYPNFEVVVIDDGSRDHTGEVVTQIASRYPRIKLVTKPNGGKFSALNLAIQTVTSEYVVTIDADTLVLPDTISNLVAPFADPGVDAVCGNIKVGNVKNLLTNFQSVEYITTQNYDRRAFEVVNCISVVPGATGAWKRSSVLRVGGYSGETLTEDADLTSIFRAWPTWSLWRAVTVVRV